MSVSAKDDPSADAFGTSHRSDRVVVINRNAWSSSIGPGGRHQLEGVVAINRNRWSPSTGVRTAEHHEVAGIAAQEHVSGAADRAAAPNITSLFLRPRTLLAGSTPSCGSSAEDHHE
jgi:hypothetical protein